MNESDFSYKNLIVWQKAMRLMVLVYAEVKKFPQEGRYAIGDQVRRAVVSIASNIAEGAGRTSNKDYAHFLAIARGSLYETMTQLQGAEMLGYVKISDEINLLAMEIGRILGSLLKKYGLLNSSTSSSNFD